ncbi:hypothetical protein Lesp02_47890 [Lentzea sp. NBRC 105346]|uniref:DUF4328 domain-containing protein n=1 Tax=Lentzea sp. NBRC 105346 TaxID=3032205 RepID=UPI0024A54F33|nr:DUF4328 domain-containing protein [Lentzea sp. NBRC 105346]GLZ32601.1 hypothetical protein Lesp02_47890 [Lentzea sp. NBRC 105346]
MLRPLRVDWVASPPPGAYAQREPAGQRPPYDGPPKYPVPPKWGFPLLAWRWPTAVPGSLDSPADSVDGVRRLARTASNALWLLAVVAVWAFGSEVWRYVLVLLSRFGALSSGVVGTSDALVVSASVVTSIVSFVALALTLLWVRRARNVSAEAVGYGPSRSDREVLIGMIVPGVNLVIPGSTVAELEHAALLRPASVRPAPSRLVLWWWGTWVASALLFVITVAWSFRSSVQAQADGIVLHALSDLAVAGVAVATALVVRRITTLLLPVDADSVRLMRVVEVRDAPEPPLRAVRASGSLR